MSVSPQTTDWQKVGPKAQTTDAGQTTLVGCSLPILHLILRSPPPWTGCTDVDQQCSAPPLHIPQNTRRNENFLARPCIRLPPPLRHPSPALIPTDRQLLKTVANPCSLLSALNTPSSKHSNFQSLHKSRSRFSTMQTTHPSFLPPGATCCISSSAITTSIFHSQNIHLSHPNS